MFARTRRLTLRPRWPEDATGLAAIEHDDSVMPYARALSSISEAQGAIASFDTGRDVEFVICAHEGGIPRLIGSIALVSQIDAHELCFWLTSDVWGRGYATEAGNAVIAIARHALPIRRLTAACPSDNAASARVLRKLGFRGPERRDFGPSQARGRTTDRMMMELDVDDQRTPMPMAA
ncbi:GNAT family N-acetyltransferase [uncultured Sphingomonas sp.]|uniref:GNAT family N-acetyltransferase n=1 Tax=uncultured Sphingomonas sp. TaxID=158754 RepID=UPI0035CA6658